MSKFEWSTLTHLSLNKKNFAKLEKTLVSLSGILESSSNNLIYVNNLSRLSKLHDGLIQNLNDTLPSSSPLSFFKTCLIFTFGIIKIVLLGTIFSLVFTKKNLSFKKSVKRHLNNKSKINFFISHMTKSNSITSAIDRFFPNKDTYSNYSVWLYIDHDKFYKQLFKKSSKFSYRNKIVMPKILSIKDNFHFIAVSVSLFFDINSKLIRERNKITNFENIAYQMLLRNQLTTSSYSNYNLFVKVKSVFEISSVKEFNLPFEGHSFEQLLINYASKIQKVRKILCYQVGPFTSSNLGVVQFLTFLKNSNFSNVHLVIRWPNNHKFILAIDKNIKYQYLRVQESYSVDKSKKKNLILLTPEAIEYESLKFLEIANLLCRNIPDVNIRLRVHPDYFFSNNFKNKLLKMSNFKNFSLSNSALVDDLNNAFAIFYCGTSICFHASKFKILPIYVKSDFGIMRNPLKSSSVVEVQLNDIAKKKFLKFISSSSKT